MQVSIIIPYYKVKQELFLCLQSILSTTKKLKYEIIVVDNDEIQSIKKELLQKFPKVVYIKTSRNVGYGEAINKGVKKARGNYLFIINPDVKVLQGTMETLYSFLQRHKNAGFAAPLLRFPDKSIYPLQGSQVLTPIKGIVALSFLNTLFPGNPISKKYWLLDWNKKETRNVDVVPGTAFMISKLVYKKIGGFDKKFFLYFEENDICKRAKEKGYLNYIVTSASILHKGAQSTKLRHDSYFHFLKSRFYYFKKHYGLFNAVLVHVFLSINKPFALSLVSVTLLLYILTHESISLK